MCRPRRCRNAVGRATRASPRVRSPLSRSVVVSVDACGHRPVPCDAAGLERLPGSIACASRTDSTAATARQRPRHMPPARGQSPWSEHGVHEPAQHEERDAQQQEAGRGERGQPKLEGVQRGQLAQVLDVLLHAQLGLARHALPEGDRHVDHRGAPASHHELEADLEAHRVDARVGAARERRLAQAEEAGHRVGRARERPRQRGGAR
mmetsp:Transcript_33844/g.85991  ORF Transcript_33844/g.85991 Transcript_33844/m.85991 type:complete len:207 (+) Transcript_33844:102-722(+)